jgi:ketosteroid isomerase-like protein
VSSVEDRNRDAVRAAFEAWQGGRAPITDLFAPKMTWRIEGHSAASGSYDSRDEFMADVLAPFGHRFPAEEPFRPVRIRHVVADGDIVVVVWDGHGVATDGVSYDNSYAWIMKLQDGKVVDGTAFYDSIAFNDLWYRLQPGRP